MLKGENHPPRLECALKTERCPADVHDVTAQLLLRLTLTLNAVENSSELALKELRV
jgi:hypothetical protein